MTPKIMSRTPREEHELYQAVQRDAAMEQKTTEVVTTKTETQESGFWQFAAVIVVSGLLFGGWWGNWGNSDKLFSPSYSTVQQYHRCAMARDDTTYIMHCMSTAGYTFEMEKCIGYGHTIISEDDGINKCFMMRHWWNDLGDWWAKQRAKVAARLKAEAAAKAAKEAKEAAAEKSPPERVKVEAEIKSDVKEQPFEDDLPPPPKPEPLAILSPPPPPKPEPRGSAAIFTPPKPEPLPVCQLAAGGKTWRTVPCRPPGPLPLCQVGPNKRYVKVPCSLPAMPEPPLEPPMVNDYYLQIQREHKLRNSIPNEYLNEDASKHN
jgi:hypothetical protein